MQSKIELSGYNIDKKYEPVLAEIIEWGISCFDAGLNFSDKETKDILSEQARCHWDRFCKLLSEMPE